MFSRYQALWRVKTRAGAAYYPVTVMGTPDRDARSCEERHDRRCDVSTLCLTGHGTALTASDPLAVAMLVAAIDPAVIAEVSGA